MTKQISNPFQDIVDQLTVVINDKFSQLSKDTSKTTEKKVSKVKIPEGYLNAKEAAKYLSVSVRWIADRKETGLLAYYQFGGAVRYLPEDLDKLGVRHDARF